MDGGFLFLLFTVFISGMGKTVYYVDSLLGDDSNNNCLNISRPCSVLSYAFEQYSGKSDAVFEILSSYILIDLPTSISNGDYEIDVISKCNTFVNISGGYLSVDSPKSLVKGLHFFIDWKCSFCERSKVGVSSGSIEHCEFDFFHVFSSISEQKAIVSSPRIEASHFSFSFEETEEVFSTTNNLYSPPFFSVLYFVHCNFSDLSFPYGKEYQVFEVSSDDDLTFNDCSFYSSSIYFVEERSLLYFNSCSFEGKNSHLSFKECEHVNLLDFSISKCSFSYPELFLIEDSSVEFGGNNVNDQSLFYNNVGTVLVRLRGRSELITHQMKFQKNRMSQAIISLEGNGTKLTLNETLFKEEEEENEKKETINDENRTRTLLDITGQPKSIQIGTSALYNMDTLDDFVICNSSSFVNLLIGNVYITPYINSIVCLPDKCKINYGTCEEFYELYEKPEIEIKRARRKWLTWSIPFVLTMLLCVCCAVIVFLLFIISAMISIIVTQNEKEEMAQQIYDRL